VETYLTYLTVFIGVLTAALAAQAVILFFIYRRLAKLANEVEKSVAHISDQSKIILDQVASLMDEINKQARRYGQVGNEISSRVQQKVNGFLDGVERISTATTNAAAAAAREASAAIHGLVAALSHLGRPKRKALPPPPKEESMAVH
jgi:methyl-accepting chemotaxis protein